MSKYIKAEDLKTKLLQKSFYPAIVAYELEHMPAADVVSRETHEAVQKALQALAETDVVQIVRCKDCIFAEKIDNETYICDEMMGGQLMDKDEYCSCGERRTYNENL